MTIRPLMSADLDALREVIAATDLFPADLLQDMAAPHLAGERPDEQWLTALGDDATPIGLAYCAPEPLTDCTANLLALAVAPRAQGRGIASALVRCLEECLRAGDTRLLIVQTSGLPAFAPARALYRKLGFTEEARLRDFYAPGDDQVIFTKALLVGA